MKQSSTNLSVLLFTAFFICGCGTNTFFRSASPEDGTLADNFNSISGFVEGAVNLDTIHTHSEPIGLASEYSYNQQEVYPVAHNQVDVKKEFRNYEINSAGSFKEFKKPVILIDSIERKEDPDRLAKEGFVLGIVSVGATAVAVVLSLAFLSELTAIISFLAFGAAIFGMVSSRRAIKLLKAENRNDKSLRRARIGFWFSFSILLLNLIVGIIGIYLILSGNWLTIGF